MRPTSLLRAAALLLVLPTGLAVGQDPTPPLAPGTRIRVHARYLYTGTLVALDTATLVLRRDALRDTVRVPVASIELLELSTGQRSGVGRGAKVGLIAGASVGALIGLAAVAEGCPPNAFICFGPEVIPVSAALLGGVGAGLGALIGAASPIDGWQQVPVRSVQVGIVPLGGRGVGLGVAIAF